MAEEVEDSAPESPEPSESPASEPAAVPPEHWSAKLVPEEVRGDPLWQRFKDPAEAFKSHLNAHKALGASIRVPKENAPKEEWDAYWTKLGRPETPAGYEIVRPENMPEGLNWSDEVVAGFQGLAHEIGLTPAQAKRLAEWDTQRQIRGIDGLSTSVAKNREASQKALKDAWGPLYQRNLNLARDAFDKFGNPQDRKEFDEKFGDDPVALRFLAPIGEFLLEHGEITGDSIHGVTPDSAQKKLDEIRSARVKDPGHPMNNPKDPAHDSHRAEYRRLLAIANAKR